MGFIILLGAICFVCVVPLFLYDNFNIKVVDRIVQHISELLSFVSWVACIAFAISLLLAIISNIGYDSFVAKNQQIYNILVYQLENNLYDNDNDLGKKELYDQIQEWNTDLASGKAWTHDPWFGIFWRDAYDEFDFIKLK